MRPFTLLFVLMLAGTPAVAAACAIECAPQNAATDSGCHKHPARGQERTRVADLHICNEALGTRPVVLQESMTRAMHAPAASVTTHMESSDLAAHGLPVTVSQPAPPRALPQALSTVLRL